MRPIGLGFQAAFAPSEGYHVAGLRQRLAGFCPAEFVTAVFGGDPLRMLEHDIYRVTPGAILTVEFLDLAALDALRHGHDSATTVSSQPQPSQLRPESAAAGPAQGPPTRASNQEPSHSATEGQPTPLQRCKSHSRSSLHARKVPDRPHCLFMWVTGCAITLCLSTRVAASMFCVMCAIGPLYRQQRILLLTSILLSVMPVAAMPSTDSPLLSCCQVPRPIPTPCRQGAFTYSVVAGPPAATVAFDTGSGCLQPSLDDAELQPLTTLLSESAAQSQEWAFLAVTLIEVLTEHFSVGAHTKPSKLEPVTIDLESAIPVTSYQQQCLDLARIIPPSRPLTEDAPDWLDNDFAPLLRFRGATQAQRTAFANIVCWHNAVAWEAVTDVDVFTDGSASSAGSVTDVAPAGWAFTVWLRTPARSLFYGAAYGTAVPPFTAYYVGETQDSALQAELLGLCWALSWVLEYGNGFHRPIHVHYDCQAAGQGTFCQAKPARQGAQLVCGDPPPMCTAPSTSRG